MFNFLASIFRKPSVKSVIVTAVGGALTALAHNGNLPIDAHTADVMLAAIVAALHTK